MLQLIPGLRLSGAGLLVSIAFCLPAPIAAQPVTHQVSLPSGMTWCQDTSIQALLTQVNTYRGQNRVAALEMNTLGMKAADLRAIAFAQYMSTHAPGSSGFDPHQGWDTTAAAIGYKVVGENLAYMTSDPVNIVYSVWQGSLHRAAMLASDANVAGVSCVYYNGTPYWTYEPGIAGGGGSTQPPATDEVEAFLTLINQYRAQNGANPVRISPTLQAASQWMANDMAAKNYASHTDSLGRSVAARLASFGYTYTPFGENIAGGYSDAQTTFNQWRDACDPDAGGTCTYAHRKAMLNPSFVAIGVGRAYSASSAYGWYWATDFGGFLDSGTTPPPPPIGTAPVISTFKATPAAISAGQTSTLSWSVSGATSITIDNGIGGVTGASSRSVTPGQTTTYRLTATNTSGSSTASVVVTVSASSDTQPPRAPVLVSGTATTATSVELTWRTSTDNVGVTGYQILRNGSPAGTVGGSRLSFSDSVAANTSYSYSIRAFDAAGNYSPSSNTLQVKTPALPSGACPAPVQGAFTGCYYNNLDMTGTPALVRNDQRIDFDWMFTKPSPAINGSSYSVRWQGGFQLTAGTYDFTVFASDGVRLFIDGSLVLDRWRDQSVMQYTIRRTLATGNHLITFEYYERSGSARAYLAWTGGAPPNTTAPAISAFTASPASVATGGATTLSWTVTGATSLTLDNGIGTVTGSTSRVVAPVRTTTYTLTASNSTASTSASVTVQVSGSTTTDTQPPSPPSLTSAVSASATSVDLRWTASTDNIGVTGYRILRNGFVVATIAPSATTYRDSSAQPASTYSYAVQAVDAAGNSSRASNAVQVTTPSSPGAIDCSPGLNVFTGCYFNNTDMTGTPVLIRTDKAIDFDWMFTRPATAVAQTNYSVRWQGTFAFEEGYYTFNATASDGMRIYIDEALVLDRWRDQPVYSYNIRRPISAGNHLITVEYYERTGSATARLSWQKN